MFFIYHDFVLNICCLTMIYFTLFCLSYTISDIHISGKAFRKTEPCSLAADMDI